MRSVWQVYYEDLTLFKKELDEIEKECQNKGDKVPDEIQQLRNEVESDVDPSMQQFMALEQSLKKSMYTN